MQGSELPAGQSTHITPSKKSRWPLLAGAGAVVLAVGAGVYWGGDVPNRYRAHQALHAGRVALLASDFPAALQALRTAATLRPTDEAVVRQYDETQTRWLEMAERKLVGSPEAAYLALQALPRVEHLLVEPHAGRYRERAEAVTRAARDAVQRTAAAAVDEARQGNFPAAYQALKDQEPWRALLPDFAERIAQVETLEVEHAIRAARAAAGDKRFAEAHELLRNVAAKSARVAAYPAVVQELREAEVKAALETARRAAEKQDFPAAKAALDQAAAVGVLAEEIEARRQPIQEQARLLSRLKLAQGIARRDATLLASALALGRECGGWTTTATPESFLAPKDFPAFLAMLAEFQLGGTVESPHFDRVDIPLVEWNRARFAEKDAVAAFLRDGYVAWSRTCEKAGHFGYALWLDRRAVQQGAKADPAWAEQTAAKAAAALDLTVHLAAAKPDPKAPPRLENDALAALRKALQQKLGAWPKLADSTTRPAKGLVLEGSFAGFSVYDDAKTETRTVRYQSGTRQVRNEEKQRIIQEHNEVMERVNRLNRSVQDREATIARGQGAAMGSAEQSAAVGAAAAVAFERSELAKLREETRRLRQQGDALPNALSEPVYDDEKYSYIKHRYTCTLRWSVTPLLDGKELDVDTWSWSAATEHQNDEITGNAARNVPVRAAPPVPRDKLSASLVPKLVAEVAKIEPILKALPDLTAAVVDERHANAKEFDRLDRFLALGHLWSRHGRPLADQTKLDAAARYLLNLPEK